VDDRRLCVACGLDGVLRRAVTTRVVERVEIALCRSHARELDEEHGAPQEEDDDDRPN
jgi:hypothetical protein